MQVLSTELSEAEELIGRLRCFNEVIAEMPRTFLVTDRERESCLQAERYLAVAMEQGRAEECWIGRNRAEAAAEFVVSMVEARPQVGRTFQVALRRILRDGATALSPDLLNTREESPAPAPVAQFGVAPAYGSLAASQPRPTLAAI